MFRLSIHITNSRQDGYVGATASPIPMESVKLFDLGRMRFDMREILIIDRNQIQFCSSVENKMEKEHIMGYWGYTDTEWGHNIFRSLKRLLCVCSIFSKLQLQQMGAKTELGSTSGLLLKWIFFLSSVSTCLLGTGDCCNVKKIIQFTSYCLSSYMFVHLIVNLFTNLRNKLSPIAFSH